LYFVHQWANYWQVFELLRVTATRMSFFFGAYLAGVRSEVLRHSLWEKQSRRKKEGKNETLTRAASLRRNEIGIGSALKERSSEARVSCDDRALMEPYRAQLTET
jgi:hypothetical protein